MIDATLSRPPRGERAADRRPVLVAEPQFKGSVHASFNAGLLVTAGLAFPAAGAVFLGEREQLRWVREAHADLAPKDPPEVEWRAIAVPGALRRIGRIRRTLTEAGTFWRLLRHARRRNARLILFCSLPRLGAAMLRLLAPRVCPRTAVLAIVHDVEKLLPTPTVGHPAGVRLFHRVLRSAPPRNLRFVAPTLLAHRLLVETDPALSLQFTPLSLPYPWRREGTPHPGARPKGTLRFGLIGSGSRERIEPFCRLARDVKRRFPAAEFVIAGHLTPSARGLGEELALLDEAPVEPLPLDNLAPRIDALDYAVWIGRSDIYRWRLSAAFLDALSHVKPTLALATPYSSFMFETMGDIGYLCADHAELLAAATALLERFPSARYQRQCATILERRRRHSVRHASEELTRTVLALATDVPSENHRRTVP